MKKDYRVKIKEKYMNYNESDGEIISRHLHTLQIAEYFICSFLNAPKFYLKVEKEEYTYEDYKIVFEASAYKETLQLILTKDYFIIIKDNQKYVYQAIENSNELEVILEEYTVTQNNRKLIEKIKNHYFIIELWINDLIYSFNIPLENSKYLPIELFNLIKENSKIEEIKKIYMHYFYSKQTAYERSIPSSLEIKKKTDRGTILLERLLIKEGFVEEYILSIIQEELLIYIKGTLNSENKIEIKDYHEGTDINLNEAASTLFKRSRKLNLSL